MRRFPIVLIFALAVCFAAIEIRRGTASAEVLNATAPATKSGWWIKVRTDRTEATSIDFQIGTQRENRETWCTWRSNDATEFDVPAKYQQVERIYISGTANPKGKHGWFCLMYKDHGVKHFDFDDRQDEDHSQTDSDGDCN